MKKITFILVAFASMIAVANVVLTKTNSTSQENSEVEAQAFCELKGKGRTFVCLTNEGICKASNFLGSIECSGVEQ